ncbi:MAG: coproporphyrinogen dehydrogenase HemZ [Eubacteriales bacterium]|nr:coproporphyrinogen dehydrogenase HemZ [Eubacteriales bacterium]
MQTNHKAQIILVNHQETAAVGDAVRQFFGNIQPDGLSFKLPSDETFTIRCSSSVELPPDLIRRLMRGELSDAERVLLPEKFELNIELKNAGGKRVWRENSVPEDLRRNIRRLIHIALSEQTGYKFPWGTLSGVRPTQVASELLEKKRRLWDPETNKTPIYSSEDKAAAFEELEVYWKVSQPKTRLALETAEAERKLLDTIDLAAGDYIVYVGLPFCPTRCDYCSFITEAATSQENLLDDYVTAVIVESEGVFQRIKRPPRAVYFGGGTPTSLDEKLFDRYISSVLAAIPQGTDIEYTMEAGRPDTITETKLESIREAGFNKICINPQSMIDTTLAAVGRCHSVADTVTAIELARQAGFDDINMDLIAGLPGDRKDGFLYSLNRVLELEPESITLHTLSVKRGAFLDEEGKAGDPYLPQAWLIRQVEEAQQQLRAAAYKPYYLYKQKTARSGLENTAFSRNQGSLYNVAMMSDEVPVIGLGSGATSKVISGGTAERLYNPKDLKTYIERVESIIEKKRSFFQNQPFA